MIYTVRYYDIEDYFDREEWARKNCKSFIQMKGTDFSDVSFSKYDVVYDFTFFVEKDAINFKLRWGPPLSSMDMTRLHDEKAVFWSRGWRKDNQGNYDILFIGQCLFISPISPIIGHRDNIVDWIMLQNPNEWQRIGAIGFKYMFSPQLETAFLLRWG